MPTSRQLRDAAAAGRDAGKNVSRGVTLLATIGAVVLARVLYSYGWGFWESAIVAAVLFGIGIGVAEGVRMLRANKS